jgi:hypothetical protein
MSSSRNWSHASFERAMKYFCPLIRADWMTYLKISPVEYSEWSDTLYICVEFGLTPEAVSDVESLSFYSKGHFVDRIHMYIKNYFESYLNTRVGIKEFRSPVNYATT